MINLDMSAMIYRPLKPVFDFVSMPENDIQWRYGTLAAAQLPKGSGSLQTYFRSIGHLMGRRNLGTFEVTAFEPEKRYGFKSLSGPIHSRTFYTLENVSGETRLHITIEASAPNFFNITEELLCITMKKQLEEDVTKLKNILEETSTILQHPEQDIQR
jgi:hypothetical protein